MTASGKPARSGKPGMDPRWASLRFLGLFTMVTYLVFGSVILMMLFIIGAWEAFRRPTYVAGFLLAVGYVYGTAWLGWRVFRRPTPRQALLLGVLLLPVLFEMGRAYLTHEAENLPETVAIYATSPDPEAVAAAGETLLEKGRRAGNPPQVRALLTQLGEAEDDATRIRLVEMLGELSYQNRDVLETLAALIEETRDDPARQALYEAARTAAGKVNPYHDPS